MSKSKPKILFLMSGSIAAFKACQVISRLVQDGNEVRVAMTASAQKFIGAATIEGLTGHATLSDLWESGRAMDHIHLTRWADRAVLCPASATTLARLAHGSAEDIVSALSLAWPSEKPFDIFPAMNSVMLANAATQENLKMLSSRGLHIHSTAAGNLACGETGAGRLLEPEEILKIIQPSAKGRVLITLGATREPLDGIRFISNVSTGQTGAHLADHLAAQGWQVTALCGAGAITPRSAAVERFSSFDDLNEKLHQQLAAKSFTSVIHAAAVSDYSVASMKQGESNLALKSDSKMKSGQDLTIHLKPNFKILERLKEYSTNKKIKVIGFKLTLNATPEEAMAAAHRVLTPSVDHVIWNDWAEVEKDRSRHSGRILSNESRGQDFTGTNFQNLDELALKLSHLIQEEGGL